MRSFRHWNPRYIRDRLRTIRYEKNHPDHPWLTQTSNSILETYLRPSDRGLEFGSGRSTLWLARRVHALVSIEHDPSWHRDVKSRLSLSGIANVDYRLVASSIAGQHPGVQGYTAVFREFSESSFDFALIDAIHRAACTSLAMSAIRPGGLLIIDNVNRYLPSATHSPFRGTPTEGPLDAEWGAIAARLQSWRSIWTSSGVTDTALYFRPDSSGR